MGSALVDKVRTGRPAIRGPQAPSIEQRLSGHYPRDPRLIERVEVRRTTDTAGCDEFRFRVPVCAGLIECDVRTGQCAILGNVGAQEFLRTPIKKIFDQRPEQGAAAFGPAIRRSFRFAIFVEANVKGEDKPVCADFVDPIGNVFTPFYRHRSDYGPGDAGGKHSG